MAACLLLLIHSLISYSPFTLPILLSQANMSVVGTLESLASAADEGQYPASNIRPDLAEAWVNGENNVQKRTLQYGESYDFEETVEHDLAGKGMGVERAVRATERCLTYINQLGDRLSKEPTAAEATEIWDTYDTVSTLSLSRSEKCY